MLDALTHVEWSEIFIPAHSVAEMIVRGTLMYLGLFLIFRFIIGRQSSAIGIADILVVVLIADAAQNASRRNISRSPRALRSSSQLSSGILRWTGWAITAGSLLGLPRRKRQGQLHQKRRRRHYQR